MLEEEEEVITSHLAPIGLTPTLALEVKSDITKVVITVIERSYPIWKMLTILEAL